MEQKVEGNRSTTAIKKARNGARKENTEEIM
jgi:hypothetical protein